MRAYVDIAVDNVGSVIGLPCEQARLPAGLIRRREEKPLRGRGYIGSLPLRRAMMHGPARHPLAVAAQPRSRDSRSAIVSRRTNSRVYPSFTATIGGRPTML